LPTTPTHIAVLSPGEDGDLMIWVARPATEQAPAGHRFRREHTDYVPTDEVVSVDEIPGSDPAQRQALADRLFANTGWTRTGDWYRFTDGTRFATLTPTHGLIAITLLVGPRNEPLPGMLLDDPRRPELPGLLEHPGVYGFLIASGAMTDQGLIVRLLPAGAPVPDDCPSLTAKLPLTEPVPDGVHYTVDMRTSEYAEHIARHPALAGTGRTIAQTGTIVWLTRAALDILGGLPHTTDGYYDGEKIWIGQSRYQVRPLTADELTLVSRCPDCNSRIQLIRGNTHAAGGNPCNNTWHDTEATV
jgi:hypothetical protein